VAVREISWDEVLQAGTVIFGPEFSSAARSGGWHRELKAAYRRRALETHPDRAHHLGRTEADLAAEFRAVAAAYELLVAMRAGAAPPSPEPTRSRTHADARAQTRHAEPRARRSAPRTDASSDERAAGPAEPRSGRAEDGPPRDRPRDGRPFGDRPRHDRTSRDPSAPFAGRAATNQASEVPLGGASAAARRLWQAGLPRRRLRLAEFLYYSGRLAWADFVAAIAWQRRLRPEVGRIAVDFGFLERHQVLEILTRRRIEQSLAVPFGEFAVRHGYLTAFQVLAVLGQQVRLQRPLGQYFVERGLVSEPELDDARLRILRHNARWAA
jgi:hypothetical protein